MIARRVGVGALVMMLVAVSAPALAGGPSAAGRAALPVRHLSAPHANASRAAWRPVAATASPAIPIPVPTLAGALSPLASVAVPSPVARPPFVPPRV